MTTRTLTALSLAAALLAAGATPAAEVPEGINDGIKVHGHWKIEILEPDGTLVSSHEFENALYLPVRMTGILAQNDPNIASLGGWAVLLYSDNTGVQPCGGGSEPCIIAEPDVHRCGFAYAFASTNLQISVQGTNQERIHFSGSVTADTTATIHAVYTWAKYCPANVAPATCTTAQASCDWFTFTSKVLTSPASVQAGQIAQATIDISFS